MASTALHLQVATDWLEHNDEELMMRGPGARTTFMAAETGAEMTEVETFLSAEAGYQYRLCGLRLSSNVALRLPFSPADLSQASDISFFLNPAGSGSETFVARNIGVILNGARQPVIHVYETASGWRLQCNNGRTEAEFVVSRDLSRIDCYPREQTSQTDIECWLFGLVLAFVLQRRGIFSLHGAAVECFGRAIAFLGNNGHGKSTLAFFFLGRGHRLVTDDVLPLIDDGGRFMAIPACPAMNLRPSTTSGVTCDHLDLSCRRPEEEKSRFTLRNSDVAFASSALPLERLYLLKPTHSDCGDKIEVARVAPTTALVELFRHTRAGSILEKEEQKTLLETFSKLVSSVPVSVLRFPEGFDHLPRVYDSIVRDLGVSGKIDEGGRSYGE